MRFLAGLSLVLLLPLRTWGVEWKFVEADLSLRPDGKATVVYRVAVDPQGMQLHGFLFPASANRPHFDRTACFATGPDGTRYGLDIKDLGDKYDIVLAEGKAVSRGTVLYVFTYGTDLSSAGHLARTASSEHGELAVLNWAPVQWDDRLGHYTLTIYWPIPVSGQQVTDQELAGFKLRTEKFMNDSYKIDYFGTEHGGKHWLSQRIHWDSVPARGQLRIHEYVDAKFFDALRAIEERAVELPAYPSGQPMPLIPAQPAPTMRAPRPAPPCVCCPRPTRPIGSP